MDPLQLAPGRYQGPRESSAWGQDLGIFLPQEHESCEVGKPRGTGCGEREAQGSGLKLHKLPYLRVGREKDRSWRCRQQGKREAKKGDHEGTQERRKIQTHLSR